jgi:site-specific DNA-methyltransferase (adenine-specific)
MNENLLYYGDNLDIMHRYLDKESVDLVYLDPPFKSNQDYNVLFAEQDGTRAASQIKAFADTWRWDEAATASYFQIMRKGGKVAEAMRAFHTFLGENDMMAYLAMMAPRLVALRRILKPTGSIYLHCDSTASHYLKLLMDAIFGPKNFRNEIVWKRTSAHNDPRRFGANVDTILFYTVSDTWIWNSVYSAHSKEYVARFRHKDTEGRHWADFDLSAKGLTGGGYEYKYKKAKSLWRCPIETMRRYDKEGRLHITKTGGIRLKRYLDETPGVVLQCLWDDIPPINSQAGERLGYPTQKPEALLQRIIEVSSNKGDLVLDPFCGCGTAIAVAQRLKRRWIGIDITHLAITLIKQRLRPNLGKRLKQIKVVGEPVSLADARALAEQDKFQFQCWALGLVDARPAEPKKGADRGIDGRRFFPEGKKRATEQIIFSVKGGHVSVKDVRDLRGVIEREAAAIGVLISLEEPTEPMRKEALAAGYYHSDYRDTDHRKLQVCTIEELLEGKQLDLPPLAQVNTTFKVAPKTRSDEEVNGSLEFDDSED